MGDKVNHPDHYNSSDLPVECIDITEHFNFNKGNAIKYIWRASSKDKEKEDLQKAIWYLQREVARLNIPETVGPEEGSSTSKGFYNAGEPTYTESGPLGPSHVEYPKVDYGDNLRPGVHRGDIVREPPR